jgi:methylenetetrahydrofolate reductase (NADPH)
MPVSDKMTDIVKRITEIFQKKARTFSFEVFPAGTPEAHARLLKALEGLSALKPDFISCTYGAGGGNRDKTLDVIEHIQTIYRIPAMAHLTCVLHTRTEIENVFKEFDRRGILNVLALRGDPPKDAAGDALGDFQYSSELVAFIRERFKDGVSIGVAGFPEKHQLAPTKEADALFLKGKIDAGADFVITQLFFDNRLYFEYVERLGSLGVTCRVIPGILPITDYGALKRFCERCGAGIPAEVHAIFGPLEGDPQKTLAAGIEYAVKQCRELLEGGAPGIHFYALNKTHPVDAIVKALTPLRN